MCPGPSNNNNNNNNSGSDSVGRGRHNATATCFTEQQMALWDKLLQYMKETSDKRERLPSLKSIPMSILKKHTQTVNEMLSYIAVDTLYDLILLMYCGAKVVGELCGVVPKPYPVFQVPPWKIRLQRKLKRLEHDLSQLCKDGYCLEVNIRG